MFVHAVPVNLASRLLALPSWQAARQLSGEDLKLLIAAKETGAEGPTLLGFAGSNVSCQAVNSLVAETWYSVFFGCAWPAFAGSRTEFFFSIRVARRAQ